MVIWEPGILLPLPLLWLQLLLPSSPLGTFPGQKCQSCSSIMCQDCRPPGTVAWVELFALICPVAQASPSSRRPYVTSMSPSLMPRAALLPLDSESFSKGIPIQLAHLQLSGSSVHLVRVLSASCSSLYSHSLPGNLILHISVALGHSSIHSFMY